MTARTWRLLGGLLVVVVLALVGPQVVDSSTDGATDTTGSADTTRTTGGSGTDPASGLPQVDAADLPAQARDVLAAIDDGGPFTYPGKDGSTFGNLEGLLPEKPRGTYREYTVPTPGEDDRGARRLVTDGDPVEVVYWTDDHYASFSVVRR